MKFIDLQSEYLFYKEEIDRNVSSVIPSGAYLFGDQLRKLERDFASHIGKRHGVGVKNCTDAIILVLKRLALQVRGADMPIILPNFGAYPTAVASRNITDNLYYVDVDETMTLDVNKLPDIQNGVVIPVHLFGNNCNMEAIMTYAKENNHIVIEDCAQSTGSGSGKYGDYSVFSFYPTKPLACMGDGGMICTDHPIDRLQRLRFYGQQDRAALREVGLNSRMDEIQASIVNAKLPRYQELNEVRKRICERYKNIVRGIKRDENSVYHQFVVLFGDRESVINDLQREQIPHIIHYSMHVSEFDVLRGKQNDVGFRVNDKCLSLPCHPFMTEDEIQKVEQFLWKHRGDEYDLY